MNEVDDTVNNIISDFDGMDDATKAALSAATNIAGGIISMITGIQALAVTGAEAIKGVERASVILSIVGTAVSLITSLFGLSSKAEKEHQEALKESSREQTGNATPVQLIAHGAKFTFGGSNIYFWDRSNRKSYQCNRGIS